MANGTRYQFRVTLCSKTAPKLGMTTICFPIPWKEYDKVLDQLKPLDIGDPCIQDCRIQEIGSRYTILERLQGTPVNLDELDYLAKRLDSFDVGEAVQFQAAAAAEGITTIRDFINLTFCCQGVTVVQDFRDLQQIGKDHLMALGGGSVSTEELQRADLRKIGEELLQNGEGKVTSYGVVYQNGMELTPLYTGNAFPDYGFVESLAVEIRPAVGSIFLPMTEKHLLRDLRRRGIHEPDNVELDYIDLTCPGGCLSSLSLEKEDIFSLNRLAMALEDLPPAEAEKLKTAVYLTEPDSSEKLIALMKKVEQLDHFLRPLSSEPSVLRLYMPLTADLFEDQFDYDREPEHLKGYDLCNYSEKLAKALVDYQMPEEAERGLMHWYNEEDSVNEKVQSVVFTLDSLGGRLWGVAECQLLRDLTIREMAALKQYITGQAADGWGKDLRSRILRWRKEHSMSIYGTAMTGAFRPKRKF